MITLKLAFDQAIVCQSPVLLRKKGLLLDHAQTIVQTFVRSNSFQDTAIQAYDAQLGAGSSSGQRSSFRSGTSTARALSI